MTSSFVLQYVYPHVHKKYKKKPSSSKGQTDGNRVKTTYVSKHPNIYYFGHVSQISIS